MNKLTPTQKAYIAGIIDGEGCFNIAKKKSHSKNGVREFDFTCRVLVVNSDMTMMAWLAKTIGEGGIYVYHKSYNPRWKPVHRWYLCGNNAVALVKQIYPYLQVKKQQAKLLLSFPCGHKGHGGRTDEQYNIQSNASETMRRLNHRGAMPV